jgi:multidrug efflux pump subunit AcrB
MRKLVVRALIVAVALAVVLIGAIVVMDLFGSQPQPFQYLLH